MSNPYAALAELGTTNSVQVVDENEEYSTDQQGFTAIAGDKVLRIGEAFPEAYPQTRVQHLTISNNRYGYVTAKPTVCFGFVVDLYRAFEALKNEKSTTTFTPAVELPSRTPISHVAFSSDGQRLYVAGAEGGLLCYDMNDVNYTSQEISTSSVAELLPNPVDSSLAIFCTNGDVLVHNDQGTKSISAKISAVAWSKKGRQLVTSTRGGELKQYNPQGDLKAELPAISTDIGHVHAINWLENDLFLLAYLDDDQNVALYLLKRTTNQGKQSFEYTVVPNPSLSFGDTTHATHYSFNTLSRSLVLTASSVSADIGLISLQRQTSLSIDDELQKAILRFSPDRDAEVSLTGLAIQNDEANERKIVWYVDNDGGCGAWLVHDMENTLFDVKDTVVPKAAEIQNSSAAQHSNADTKSSPFASFGSGTESSFAQSPFAMAQANAPKSMFGPNSSSISSEPLKAPAFPASIATNHMLSAFGKSAFGSNAFGSNAFGSSTLGTTKFGIGTSSTAKSFGGFGSLSNNSKPVIEGAKTFGQSTSLEKQKGHTGDDSEDEGLQEDKLAQIDEQEPRSKQGDSSFDMSLKSEAAAGSTALEAMAGFNLTNPAFSTASVKKNDISESSQVNTSTFGNFSFPQPQPGGFGFKQQVISDSKTPQSVDNGAFVQQKGFDQVPASPVSAFGKFSFSQSRSGGFDFAKSAADSNLASPAISTTSLKKSDFAPAPTGNPFSAFGQSSDLQRGNDGDDSVHKSFADNALPPQSQASFSFADLSNRNPSKDTATLSFGNPLKTPLPPSESVERSGNDKITEIKEEAPLSSVIESSQTSIASGAQAISKEDKYGTDAEAALPSDSTAETVGTSTVTGAKATTDSESSSRPVDPPQDDLQKEFSSGKSVQDELKQIPPFSFTFAKAQAEEQSSPENSYVKLSESEEGPQTDGEGFAEFSDEDEPNAEQEEHCRLASELQAENDGENYVNDSEGDESAYETEIEDEVTNSNDEADYSQDESEDASVSGSPSSSSAFTPKTPAFAPMSKLDTKESPFTDTSLLSAFGASPSPAMGPPGPVFDFAGAAKPRTAAMPAQTRIGPPVAASSAKPFIFEQSKTQALNLPQGKFSDSHFSSVASNTRVEPATTSLTSSQSGLQPFASSERLALQKEQSGRQIVDERALSSTSVQELPPLPRLEAKLNQSNLQPSLSREILRDSPKTLELPSYAALSHSSVNSNESGIARELDILIKTLNIEITTMGANIDSVNAYIAEGPSFRECLDNVTATKTEVEGMLTSVADDGKDHQAQLQNIAMLKSAMLKLEGQRIKVQRLIRAQTDPAFAHSIKVSSLGPEDQAQQRELRKRIASVEDNLQDLQASLSLTKSKLISNQNDAVAAPSPDRIALAVSKIMRVALEKERDVERLQRRLVSIQTQVAEGSLRSSNVTAHRSRMSRSRLSVDDTFDVSMSQLRLSQSRNQGHGGHEENRKELQLRAKEKKKVMRLYHEALIQRGPLKNVFT